MGRPRNNGLESARSRSTLLQRIPAYWARISEGRHLGYRKGLTGGHWLARVYDPKTRRRMQKALGEADDRRPADGKTVLTYDQARAMAEEWFREIERLPDCSSVQARETEISRMTVIEAVEAYLEFLASERKGAKQAEQAARKYILSRPLGARRVVDLTMKEIDSWRKAISAEPRSTRVRSKNLSTARSFRRKKADEAIQKPPRKGKWALEAEGLSGEELRLLLERRRKSTSNRVLTILKAALTRLRIRFPDLDDRPWRDVKPFKNVDGIRTQFLEVDEQRRLLDACPQGLKELVAGAMLTGARYGELAVMRVHHVFPRTHAIRIEDSKSSSKRFIPLSEEGAAFFLELIKGRSKGDLVFTRADGSAWGKSFAFRPFWDACEAASLPPIAFHCLRHTYASQLIMAGAELKAVAEALGHASTVMVDRHYGHLRQSWLQKQIDTYSPRLFREAAVNPTPAMETVARPRRIGRIVYDSEGRTVKSWREEP